VDDGHYQPLRPGIKLAISRKKFIERIQPPGADRHVEGVRDDFPSPHNLPSKSSAASTDEPNRQVQTEPPSGC